MKSMSYIFLSNLKRYSTLALAPFLLSACVNMESGMRINALKVPSTGDQPAQTPVIKLITPSVVQEVRAEKERLSDEPIIALFGRPTQYLIGPGDLLSILVWDHPELNIAAAGAQALSSSAGAQTPSAFVVDQQGLIQFPFVGAVKVAGLTELQARNLLAERLIKSIKHPDLTVRVLAYRSKKVYLDGELRTPGNQVIDDTPMTLLEGITRAGGFLPTSDQSQITLSRDGMTYRINLPLLVRHGVDMSSLILQTGDIVHVASRDENKVYVLGEVTMPKAVPMNNGRLTLASALGEAGGLNQVTSAARQVYVVRNANSKDPVVFNLDAASPVALALAEGFELNPKDVVFVDASGLARYNRVISLILPTAATAANAYAQVNR
jgi:polysaccharide biosynthesis/export protein